MAKAKKCPTCGGMAPAKPGPAPKVGRDKAVSSVRNMLTGLGMTKGGNTGAPC